MTSILSSCDFLHIVHLQLKTKGSIFFNASLGFTEKLELGRICRG